MRLNLSCAYVAVAGKLGDGVEVGLLDYHLRTDIGMTESAEAAERN